MYRLMQPSDKAAVLALWQRERGESEEFAANAVERFAGQQNVYVAEENDVVAAAALAVAFLLRGTWLKRRGQRLHVARAVQHESHLALRQPRRSLYRTDQIPQRY